MLTTDRGFIKAILLNIVTLGIYNLYLISCFASETNQACQGDGRSTKGLVLYILLSIITFGIYPLFWVVNWLDRCNNYLAYYGQQPILSGTNYVLGALFGWITLGIWPLINYSKMLYTQNAVNGIYNSNNGGFGMA